MKALFISDDENLVKECSSVLEKNNYDLIVYKWLLKALDNIEEIKPDLIIVSSSEYPRHWKTLVQFVKSGIGGQNVVIYLYEPTPLSKDDLDKSRILGINGYFTKVDELESLLSEESDEIPSVGAICNSTKADDAETFDDEIPCVDSIIENKVEIPAFTEQNSVIEEKVPDNEKLSEGSQNIEEQNSVYGHVLLSNPENNCFMTGKVDNISEKTMFCSLDFNTNLKPDVVIEKGTYIYNGELKTFNSTVVSLTGKKLELLINNYYEEN